MKPDELYKDLYGVLSALRGPDNEDSLNKAAATALIRRAAFPKRASRFHNYGPAYVDPTSSDEVLGVTTREQEKNVAVRQAMSQNMWDHFKRHAEYAFKTLGLKWNEVNS